MNIKVDKLTPREFSEYVDSTFARQVKMTVRIFFIIVVTCALLAAFTGVSSSLIKPLWISAGLLAALLAFSDAGVGILFRASSLQNTSCRYRFDQEGMNISFGKLKGDLDWEHVNYVKETQNLWIMRVPNSQFILPKRCYDDAALSALFSAVLPEEKIKPLKQKTTKREDIADDDTKNK